MDESPVRLEWVEEKGGPANPIGESSMPKTGPYEWTPTYGMPAKVYLRMTIRDKAGNESVCISSLVDLRKSQ